MADQPRYDEPRDDDSPRDRRDYDEPRDDDERSREPRDDDDRRRDRDPRPRSRAPQPNGIATASLVLGILSICGGITSIPGIICGIIGISRSKERGSGNGKAITGLVLSICGMLIVIPATLIGLLLPAVSKVREAAGRMQSSNNLKQVGLGMMNYDSANGQLPPQAICDKNGKKLLSWRVAILPYVEQDALFEQFKLDEPWDSPNNKPLIKRMPKMYMTPAFAPEAADGLTRYQVFSGKNSAFTLAEPRGGGTLVNPNSMSSLTSSPRGTSNLIFCIEGGDPVIWTKPDDIEYVPGQPLPDLKPIYMGTSMVLRGDGSVMSMRKGTPAAWIAAAIDPEGDPRITIDP